MRDPVFETLFGLVSKDVEEILKSPEFIFGKDSLMSIKKQYAELVAAAIKNKDSFQFVDLFFNFKNSKHLTANAIQNHLNQTPSDTERICYSVLNKSLKEHNPDENYLKPLAKVLARKLSEHENRKTGAFAAVKELVGSLPDYELISIDGIDTSPISNSEVERVSDFIESTILFRKRNSDSDVLDQREVERVFRDRASRVITTYFGGYLAGIKRIDILNKMRLNDIAREIKEDPDEAARRMSAMIVLEGNQDKFKDCNIKHKIDSNEVSRIEEVLRLIGLQVIYRKQKTSDTFKNIVG